MIFHTSRALLPRIPTHRLLIELCWRHSNVHWPALAQKPFSCTFPAGVRQPGFKEIWTSWRCKRIKQQRWVLSVEGPVHQKGWNSTGHVARTQIDIIWFNSALVWCKRLSIKHYQAAFGLAFAFPFALAAALGFRWPFTVAETFL